MVAVQVVQVVQAVQEEQEVNNGVGVGFPTPMFCGVQGRGVGRIAVIILVFLLLLTSFSYSKTIVVDSNAWCLFGVCIGACTSGDYGTDTISDGLSHANKGDIVEICPGTYREYNLNIKKDNLTIVGLGNNPTSVEITARRSAPIFYISSWKTGITIENLYIRQRSRNSQASAIYSPAVTNLTLKNIQINSNSYGIVLDKAQNISFSNLNVSSSQIAYTSSKIWGNSNSISSSTFTSTKNDALNFDTVDTLSISGTTLKAKKGDDLWIGTVNTAVNLTNDSFDQSKYEGVNIQKAYGKVNVDTCTFKDNGDYGLYIKSASSGGSIVNSVFEGSNTAELYLLKKKAWSGFDVENNCFEKGSGNNVINRDRSAKFQSNYYNDYTGSGSYEIPVIPLYDPSPESECHISILPAPIASWRMDACTWNGTQGEVKDSIGPYNGSSVNAKTTQGYTCNGADLTGGGYITLNNIPILSNAWTLSLWVKFPLNPTNNQYQSNGKYYFIIASVSGAGDLGYFAKDGNGNYYFGVYDNGGYIAEKEIGVISDGWHMVTLVSEYGYTLLYMDGQFTAYVQDSTYGSLYIIGSSTDSSSQESLNTKIDEALLFSRALTQKQIQTIYQNEKSHYNYNGTTRNCQACMSIDHYEIIHPQTAFTCEPATITIKACSNQSCSKLYTGSVSLTLNWDGQSEAVSFSGGTGKAEVSYNQVGSIDLSITNPTPAPQSHYTCLVEGTSGQSCQMSFENAGFVFKSPNEASNVVDSTTSCTPTQMQIYAVTNDNGTCTTPDLNGSVTLLMYATYVNPSKNPYNTKVAVNGTPITTLSSSQSAAGTPVAVSFNNGIGTFTFSYPDAGSIKLHAEYNGSFKLEGTSNDFTVKPYKFALSVDKSNPASKSNCTSDSCYSNTGIFTKAGDPFNLTIKAECKDGTVTKNFSDTVDLQAVMISPDNGTDDSPYLAVRSVSNFNGGVAAVKEKFKDVGVVNLKAVDKDYLNAGRIEGSIRIGRFIPTYFYVEPHTGTLKNMCTTFNYVNQPIAGYSTQPYFTVYAKSEDNVTTPHYKGYFFKLTKSDIAVQPPQGDDFSFTQGSTTFSKADGTGAYKFSGDRVTFKSDKATAPFTPKIYYTVESVEDSDGVECKNCPVKVEITGSPLKYGRIKIFDNFGPTTLPLSLDVQTQYWDGSSWVKNTDDICTALKPSYFTLSDYEGKIKPNMVRVQGASGVNMGDGTVTLSPPGQGNYGSVVVGIDAPFCGWLCTSNTPGTAFFGLYRGNDRILEWKTIKPE